MDGTGQQQTPEDGGSVGEPHGYGSAHVVYLVEAVGLGLYKIGIAQILSRRLRGLSAGSPVPIRLHSYLKMRGHNARDVERMLHVEYARYLSHGEWYRLPPEIVDRPEAYGPTICQFLRDARRCRYFARPYH